MQVLTARCLVDLVRSPCGLCSFDNVRINNYLCILFCHKGRTNLPPEKVPWDAFRTLLSQCIYGGKIDNEFDQV